jgi:hypothetical protein
VGARSGGGAARATLLLLDACYAGSLDARKRKWSLPTAADGLVREFAYD